MDLSVEVWCPACGGRFSVLPNAVGEMGRCPHCGHEFQIQLLDPVQTAGDGDLAARAGAVAGAPPVGGGGYGKRMLTPRMAGHLRATRPWVMVMCVLIDFGAVIMLVGGLGIIGRETVAGFVVGLFLLGLAAR